MKKKFENLKLGECIITFETFEEFQEFFPFILENSFNRNSWKIKYWEDFTEHHTSKFCIHIENFDNEINCSYSNLKFYESDNSYKSLKKYSYQEWKIAEFEMFSEYIKSSIINQFEIW